jgi:hypothetical protein
MMRGRKAIANTFGSRHLAEAIVDHFEAWPVDLKIAGEFAEDSTTGGSVFAVL